jgi:two-component system cell cycle sensor histidine kinase/response regulator CckA
VLEAATPLVAWNLFEEHGEDIDLLLTDLVMPEMNGPTLAQKFIGRRPALRVLLISGYADMAAPFAGAGPPMGFLGKPFDASALTKKVRDMLAGSGETGA